MMEQHDPFESFDCFKELLYDHLVTNGVILNMISDNDNTMTIGIGDNGRVKIRPDYSADEISYKLNYYTVRGNLIEMLDFHTSNNPFDAAEHVIKFTRVNSASS